ncbi:xylan 1,4-beta-xylosidase [Duganella sp. CF402]|uniref:GH39 family glycosyl hydrolase n=1 Tax=unclassified Duganella TaxID=2636909 RepID=UPI0008B43DF8|nr:MULTISPECIES: beta-xylosidase [unclassified Duganella]RZT06252.1 xylan 1,4-beta-xylosidase [Duganella sp. BK701]SEM70495.1 xylan 1,4-beta-xylosidase [Duganella sp. CF402]
MKRLLTSLCLAASAQLCLAASPAPVKLTIDANQVRGPMTPIWAWFGYDEPNYTTAPNGKKLLTDIAALSPVPVYVRAHNLMTSGDGSYALKWGSTGMYSEDKNGKPVYNWAIVDQIFDTYVQRKMKPLAQIGFMPQALSQRPEPYQHHWQPGTPYQEIMTGWATPPNDYDKWAELIYQWVRHSVERYGQQEVESWYWEVWNEPDGHYLIAPDTKLEYFKMYDYAADAVKRALPTARMGGPHTAGAGRFMDDFLQHALHGKNFATGKTGSPLDFVAFHAKGAPTVVNGVVRMGMGTHFKRLDDGFALVQKYPELKGIPVIIGESDPEGCAACGMRTNPENAYRNGTLYASYTAASIAREYDLAARRGVNLIGAVNWSFEFEDQPWYAGFRDLATNGVNKPVLNVFRMLGMMRGERVTVGGDQTYDAARIQAEGVRGARTDINALATRDGHSIAVMVWNYHDDDLIDSGAPVELQIAGIPAKQVKLRHFRIDQEHSNSYSAWLRMGSPASPTAAQAAQLQQASELAQLGATSTLKTPGGKTTVQLQLPRQAVSLVTLSY